MGLLSWFSGLFQPKEVRDAVKEGEAILKDAKKKEKASALSRKEVKDAMWEGRAIMKGEMADVSRMRKEAQDHLKKVSKMPSSSADITAKDEEWFASEVKSDAQKEAELVKRIQKSMKVQKPDELQRSAESITKLVDGMAREIRDAEKMSIRMTQQVVAQQNEIERLSKLLVERAEISNQLSLAVGKRMISFNKEAMKEEQKLYQQLGKKDQDILESFQKITVIASAGSNVIKDADLILQTLAPVAVDAPMLNQKVNDEIKYAKSIIKFESNVLAAMKPSMKSKAAEVDRIRVFVESLAKKAA